MISHVGAAKFLPHHHCFYKFFLFAALLQCTLAVWYSACTTMTNGGNFGN
jgi:hypothetical protein